MPMHEAAFRGNGSILQALQRMKTQINIIDTPLQHDTPLFKAVSFGKTIAVERLVKMGPLPNVLNATSDTPLQLACRNINVDIVDVF